MASEFEWHWAEGDHKSVFVASAETSIEFIMASSSTSSSDTASSKYFDNVAKTVAQFDLVADKDVQITKINDITLTDPLPIDGNKSYGEKEGKYNKITVKTTVADTVITVRVR